MMPQIVPTTAEPTEITRPKPGLPLFISRKPATIGSTIVMDGRMLIQAGRPSPSFLDGTPSIDSSSVWIVGKVRGAMWIVFSSSGCSAPSFSCAVPSSGRVSRSSRFSGRTTASEPRALTASTESRYRIVRPKRLIMSPNCSLASPLMRLPPR